MLIRAVLVVAIAKISVLFLQTGKSQNPIP